MRQLRIPAFTVALGMLIAACGSSGGPSASAITEIGEGEGELNLIIWAGYAERGESRVVRTTTGSTPSRRRPAASSTPST